MESQCQLVRGNGRSTHTRIEQPPEGFEARESSDKFALPDKDFQLFFVRGGFGCKLQNMERVIVVEVVKPFSSQRSLSVHMDVFQVFVILDEG